MGIMTSLWGSIYWVMGHVCRHIVDQEVGMHRYGEHTFDRLYIGTMISHMVWFFIFASLLIKGQETPPKIPSGKWFVWHALMDIC